MIIDISVCFIYSSPEHHYFTRKKFDVGEAETIEHKSVFLEPNRGIKDDRFENSKFPLTFVSEELMKEVCNELDLSYKPQLFRRNIVISGMNLNQLIGKTFTIDDVEFKGLEHCAPCTWMNAVMKKGAYALMSGRGGLRVKVTKKGTLKLGTNHLITKDNFELLPVLEALKKPNLP